MRHRPALLIAAVIALGLGSVGLISGPTTAAAAGTAQVRFASPTVVNPFVPGFEPDVVVDGSHTASRGRLYSSWPNGFSTTISYLERSDDDGASFHPTGGSAGGKPATCVGGGDSEMQLNGKDGQLLFADLQGLTNFSTSASSDGGDTFTTSCTGVTGAGVDRQWIAIDDNGGTSPIGPGAADGRAYLFYDNILQNTSTSNLAGNQPVVNVSSDGVNYGGCIATSSACKSPAAVISAEDDIVGNAFVDSNPKSPRYHAISEVRGSSNSKKVLFSTCRGAAAGTVTTAAATAAVCADPTAFAPGDTGLVSTHWSDHVVSTVPAGYTVKSFVVGAIDTAGNIYVTWCQYPLKGNGAYAGPGEIMLATSTNGGSTWSSPRKLNPPSQPGVIFPWITAGDPGRVDIAWYGAAASGDPYGPDAADHVLWDVYLSQSVNALASKPTYHVVKVTDHHVKYSGISTGGLGGSADRSLGDFLQVKTGLSGEALISYVDDTSGNRNNDICQGCGQTPAEAAGPTMLARQVAGPSLYAGKGTVGNGMPAAGFATDPVGEGYPDAYLSLPGPDTDGSKGLDIRSVGITQPDSGHLTITLRTGDPGLIESLIQSPTQGGLYANWRVRWAGRYGTSGKDGQIWYVGLQVGPDGAQEYYVGKTASIDTSHAKYFAYPTGTSVPGKIRGNAIIWTVPTSAIGNPKKGDGLYSVTGFTAMSALPDRPIGVATQTGTGQVGDEDTLGANLIDAAPSFSYVVGAKYAVPPGINVGGDTGGGAKSGSGGLAATGLGVAFPVAGLVLIGAVLVLRRRRAT
ncbi:MAG: hypothetical protein ABR549_03305 [Mycobacteriales bacterium]